jgi:hypothetical protein
MTSGFCGNSAKRNGMMEYWSVGVMGSGTNIPIFHHSSTPIL